MPEPGNHIFHGWHLEAWALMPFSVLEQNEHLLLCAPSLPRAWGPQNSLHLDLTKNAPSAEVHTFALSLGYL